MSLLKRVKRLFSDNSDGDAAATNPRHAQKIRIDAGPLASVKATGITRRNALVNILFEPYRYPFICDAICSFFELPDILNLRQVHKTASRLHGYLWDVDRRLERFVQNPKAFRSQMGKYNALISGSFALQFFERVLWKDSDLDLYVDDEVGAIPFGCYLCEEEGYELVEERDEGEYVMRDLINVRTYLRPDQRKIQIIGVAGTPLLAIFRSFYTTAVVNFISWNKAYAIFPRPTFLYHKTYLLKCLDGYFADLMAKYSKRGWQSRDIMWPEENTQSASIRRIRRVGDRHTWTIPLDVSDMECPEAPDSVIEMSGFSMSKPSDNHWEHDDHRHHPYHYTIAASTFDALVLRHRYTHGMIDGFWYWFLGPRVYRLTTLDFAKLPPDRRPSWFQGQINLYEAVFHFDAPEHWPFVDHEVLQWHAAWALTEGKEILEALLPHDERY